MQSACSCSSSCVHGFPFSWLTAHLSRLHVGALIQTVRALSILRPTPHTPASATLTPGLGSYWYHSALTADRFGVMFIDLHVGWICRWGGLTRCDLGRVPRRRMAATSGWAGRAAMQQSRWAALRALTPCTQTHKQQLTDTPFRCADRCVWHAGMPPNSKIKCKKVEMHTDQCKTHSHTLSYKHWKGVPAAVLQAETDGALTWLCMSVCSTPFSAHMYRRMSGDMHIDTYAGKKWHCMWENWTLIIVWWYWNVNGQNSKKLKCHTDSFSYIIFG